MSVVKIENEITYENGEPTAGGINDTRMGVASRDQKECQTCAGGKFLGSLNRLDTFLGLRDLIDLRV